MTESMSAAPIETPVSVPLTTWQRTRLAASGVLRALAAALVATGIYTVAADELSARPVVFLIATIALVGAGIAFTVALVRPAVRDLRSGVALMQDDRLLRSWTEWSRRRLPASYGQFERLGKLRVPSKLEWVGVPYRVTYSPASEIAWSATPIAHIRGAEVYAEKRRASRVQG